MASHATPASGSSGEAKKSDNSIFWDILLWGCVALSLLGFVGNHFEVWGDSDSPHQRTEIADEALTESRRSPAPKLEEHSIWIPAAGTPEDQWTRIDYEAGMSIYTDEERGVTFDRKCFDTRTLKLQETCRSARYGMYVSKGEGRMFTYWFEPTERRR